MAAISTSFDYEVLKQSSNLKGNAPTIDDIQAWGQPLVQRKRGSHRSSIELVHSMLKELEDRHQVHGIWGTTTTPALQTLECIQKVKQAITEQADDDAISSTAFAWLVGVSFVGVVAILLFWELHMRPQR
mmetsp:Transcript_26916/g.58777  ORF Transcript_26916/g.58777 Transcript_26916/m.58777 type:complete len:130 (-) Transcript_26916:1614-2003(-)